METTESTIVDFKISNQGGVAINAVYVHIQSDDICAIVIDTLTTRFDIAATGSDENDCPTIDLIANKHSQFLAANVRKYAPTEITLTNFRGWSVFCADADKSSVMVCLIKRENK